MGFHTNVVLLLLCSIKKEINENVGRKRLISCLDCKRSYIWISYNFVLDLIVIRSGQGCAGPPGNVLVRTPLMAPSVFSCRWPNNVKY